MKTYEEYEIAAIKRDTFLMIRIQQPEMGVLPASAAIQIFVIKAGGLPRLPTPEEWSTHSAKITGTINRVLGKPENTTNIESGNQGIRAPGEPHGCSDSSPPKASTPAQLSRILDLLDAATRAGLTPNQKDQIFAMFPEPVKLEFNYSKWKYVP